MRRVRGVFAWLVALLLAMGCAHAPSRVEVSTSTLNESDFYFDNDFHFQPKRMWRVVLRWEPYPMDDTKAYLLKEFQWFVRGADEQKKLEAAVQARGGEPAFLDWFEAELQPLTKSDARVAARVARFQKYDVVVVTTRSATAVLKEGGLGVGGMLQLSGEVRVPDPLVRGLSGYCQQWSTESIAKDDSVGVEVVLESRSPESGPKALRWKRVRVDNEWVSWSAWSVGQGSRVAYRRWFQAKREFAQCPLPPAAFEEWRRFQKGVTSDQMGIAW